MSESKVNIVSRETGQVSFKTDAQLHAAFKSRVALNKSDMKRAIEGFMRQYISDSSEKAGGKNIIQQRERLSPEESVLVEALLAMSRSDDSELWPVVKHNLKLWIKRHPQENKVRDASKKKAAG